ncbi:general secretion pathway protein I [Vibrio xiamenensis]|uniref:Type II secretion system protein I n=1 Tax=Vibrio xiamenensis TaxID=861298 RepID=A0A1G8F396_9VIBR|nr:type II secretion system minor pseudopilin GspI [Vibrio xiamenensis]SDH76489.1 general secretion pathway protein I [Vibrio xiamenensis]
MSKPSHNARGMTLLEVLIALAIFATAAIAIIRSVSQHINTLTYLEEKTFASLVVDNQMAKVMLGEGALTKQKGKEEMAGRTWYWQITPVKTANNLLQAFTVSVAASEKGAPILSVSSYVEPQDASE